MKIVFFVFAHFALSSEKVPIKVAAPRIIGGSEVSIQEYPFMASIILKFYKGDNIFSGGASIIGKYWAITAAHCVTDFQDGLIATQKAFVRSNTTHWRANFAFSRDHLVVASVTHEQYDTKGEDYDIGLLKVDEPFSAKFEKPITFAKRRYEYVKGTTATVLGWGTTEADSEPHTVRELRAAHINLVEDLRCKRLFNVYNISLTRRMFCASAPNRDACINDSGGPLIQRSGTGKYMLIGIVSWGITCASSQFPGVYTKLSEFEAWMSERIHHHHRHRTDDKEYFSNSFEITDGGDEFDVYDV